MTRPPRPALPLLVAAVLLLLLSPPAPPLSWSLTTRSTARPPARPTVPAAPPVSPQTPPLTTRPTAPGVDHPPTPATLRPVTGRALRAAGGRSGWRSPVPGPVTVVRSFAPGPQRWSPGHRGVDLGAAVGSPVLAAGPGRVVFAGPVAGRGVVSVAHGDLRTTYEPVAPAVRAGDEVAAATVLGVLDPGHAGCGTCLHWGLRRGDDYLDPMRLLRPVRVRLLPLTGADP